MRKALTIVLVVAIYCLCETLLLLLSIDPNYPYLNPRLYQWIIWWGQLLAIPGLAALFSRLLYGSARWGIRALTIVVVSIATMIFMIAWAYGIDTISPVMWASPFTTAVFVGFILLLGRGIAVSLFFFFRYVTRRTAEIERRRWLAEREAGTDPRAIRWRNRGMRWASWLPSVVVLTVFLFLPETWGILSHLGQPQAGMLPGYKVPIPTTWIILSQESPSHDGSIWLRGIASQGMGLDFRRYLRADLQLSYWGVEYDQSRDRHWVPTDDQVIGRRTLAIDSETITCLEYLPSYLMGPNRVKDSSIAFIQCYGSHGLYADMSGEKNHVATFYKMLESITKIR